MHKNKKSTEDLLNEIKQTDEIQKFIDRNNEEFLSKPLHEVIAGIINDKGLKKAEVVARSGLNRIYGYQILSGKRVPSRDKLIALCFGLKFGLDETNGLLKYSGNSELYAKNKRDSIIIFAINSGKSVFSANELLFENGFEILTA